jgi:hypothetical protein
MQHYRRFYYSVTPSPTACYNSFSNEIHSGGVAMVVLVLSIIPNFVMMANPGMMPFPGGSALTFGVLIVFHVVAGLVSVWVLTRSAAVPSK